MDETQAEELARERYGWTVRATELPSSIDQNFLLEDPDGRRHVLKLAWAGQPVEELELEHAAMRHLEVRGFPAPLPVPDREGRDLDQHAGRWARILTWIEGRPMAELEAPSPALLEDLGARLGELDLALADFAHPASDRHLRWDLLRAGEIAAHLEHHRAPARRARVERTLERFGAEVLARLTGAPQGVIHNDANDWNVLVDARNPELVAGLVDFGDVLHTALVSEPAIALTYAMLAAREPLDPVRPLLAGYHRKRPLSELEVGLLADLIETRLCLSVTIAAFERSRNPGNDYATVSESHAWRLLEWFDGSDRDSIARCCEEVCAG